jgi:hypothetical protein
VSTAKGTVRVRLVVDEWHGETWDREPDYNTTLATFSPTTNPHQIDSPLDLLMDAVKNATQDAVTRLGSLA